MNENRLLSAFVLGIACSISFIVGYGFKSIGNSEKNVAAETVSIMKSREVVFDRFHEARYFKREYDTLASIKSMDDVYKYRERAAELLLVTTKSFEDAISNLHSPKHEELFKPYLEELKISPAAK